MSRLLSTCRATAALVPLTLAMGCNVCETLTYKGNEDCFVEPSEPCSEQLTGEWEYSSLSDIFWDAEDPTAVSAYCYMENPVMELAFGGNGSEGHALGTFAGSGDLAWIVANAVQDVGTYEDRLTAYGGYLFAVGTYEADDDVTIEIYTDIPEVSGGSGAVLRSTLEGYYEPVSDTIVVEDFSADPTYNGASDAMGCHNFYFANVVFARTSTTSSTATLRWEAEADPATDEVFEACPSEDTGEEGDTGDTGASAEEDVLAAVPAMPDGYPSGGHFPSAAYATLAAIWQSAEELDDDMWRQAAHIMWDELFVSAGEGVPLLVAVLLGSEYGREDWIRVKTEGHRFVDGIANHPEHRNVLNRLAAAYSGGDMSAGEAEWTLYWVVRSVPVPGMPPKE